MKLFSGRISRMNLLIGLPHWIFIHVLLLFILSVFGIEADYWWVGLLAGILWAISLYVRRLHDLGDSGWWVLPAIIFPPSVIYLLAAKGENEENKYGPPPSSRIRYPKDILGID